MPTTFEDPFFYWGWLRDKKYEIENRLFRKGRYSKIAIPKPGKAGTRTIEVPPDATRVVARSLLNCLVPILDPDFHELSFGFRPKRSLLDAMASAELLGKNGYTHWVACDIRDAFGQLPKARTLQLLNNRLYHSPIKWLIEELLDRNRSRGVPQGLAISPLMLNIYLDHNLDQWWKKQQPDTALIRYADDLLVLCKSRDSARTTFDTLKKRVSDIGLKLKESQHEAIYDLNQGEVVDWLGFRVRRKHPTGLRFTLSDASWMRLESRISEYKQNAEDHWWRQDDLPVNVDDVVVNWFLQKSVAVDESQVPAVLDRILTITSDQNVLLEEPTEDWARQVWRSGIRYWKKARGRSKKNCRRWLNA